MTVQVETQKPIRTTTLKLLVDHGISVARFRANAKRTRLANPEGPELTEEKFKRHYKLWQKYGWVQIAKHTG